METTEYPVELSSVLTHMAACTSSIRWSRPFLSDWAAALDQCNSPDNLMWLVEGAHAK